MEEDLAPTAFWTILSVCSLTFFTCTVTASRACQHEE